MGLSDDTGAASLP